MATIVEVPRRANPFPVHGVSRDASGIAHYDGLPENLVDMLRRHAQATPDAEAVVELGGERLTYSQLWQRAARVAGGLRAGGVGTGDRIAVRYPAGADWVLGFWGAVFAGAVPVAVNTRFTEPEVAFVLADADVAADLAPGAALPDGAPYVADGLRAGDVAALFYTSGTTGNPKGVPTTHEAFLSNAESLVRCIGTPLDSGAQFRTLISVPLFHVTGCNSQLLAVLHAGGCAVIMPVLDRAGLLGTLAQERISFLVTVPAVYTLLLADPSFVAADLSTVRWVGYGGAPIASSLVRRLQAAFPSAEVFNGFGLTETASLLTVLPDHDAAAHADSVGFAVPVVDLAIDVEVDTADGSGTAGELLARGPNITSGYWNLPDTNATTFTDGWLRTGDIVRVDGDGRIHIVDRAKDIIIRGGENVSSVEVEDALTDAPGVAEVAVIAVPDEVMGEKVGAVLVPSGGEIDVPTVLAHAARRLADFKVPQYIAVVDGPLPRNAAGKLRKNELRRDVRWGDPLR